MTKGQLMQKWGDLSKPLKNDIDAVIATEIAKVQEAKLKHADQVTDQVTDHEQPEKQNTMVQEKQLKELFKYIEANWDVCVSQVDKTDIKRIFGGVLCEDIMNDTLHEVKAEQPAPFDRDRFEAMFRAVVASGKNEHWEEDINVAKWAIEQLDAYYAEKGGNNG